MNLPFHWIGFKKPLIHVKRSEIIQYLVDTEGGQAKVLDRAQSIEAEDLITDMFRDGWKKNPRGMIEYLEGP